MIPCFKLHESVGRVGFTFLNYSTKEALRLRRMIEKTAARQKDGKSYSSLLEKSTLSTAYGNEGSSKRVAALNKVYMEHLSLMINSGHYGKQLGDLGIEISKIQFARGLNFLNLHWIIRRADIPENVVNKTLMGVLAELQQQIGMLRFTSKVPFLRFVKDLSLEREMHLERVFQTADFGKDFQPVHGKKVVTPDFVPQQQQLPEMRQNVLGLDHAAITKRIQTDIVKFKAINIDRTEDECTEVKHESPQKLIVFNRKDFYKFYKRKRILELKLRKMNAQRRNNEYDYAEFYTDTYEDMYEPEDDDEDEYDEDECEEDEGELEHKCYKKEY